ncbi:MAG: RsfS/YbeB/iojap family protein [Saprospiraceae bacterium]|nr:RsfS/YbeB/iojap family protein [Saprospiraceae bacterium]
MYKPSTFRKFGTVFIKTKIFFLSKRQTAALKLRAEEGLKSIHVEGMLGAKWVLVDFFNTVLHVFYPETRGFYDLEDLWSDAEVTEYDDV